MAEVPETIAGYISKQRGKNRWLGSHQKRYLKVESGKLLYYGTKEEANGGKASRGCVDFIINSCQVEADGATSFKISPIGSWKDGNNEEGREFSFDANSSEYSREKWMEAIEAHISYGEWERAAPERAAAASRAAEKAAEEAAAAAAKPAPERAPLAASSENELEPGNEPTLQFQEARDQDPSAFPGEEDEEGELSSPPKPPPKLKSVKAKSVRPKAKGKAKAKSVREKPTAKADNVREKPTAKADSVKEKPTAKADNVKDKPTMKADSVREKPAPQKTASVRAKGKAAPAPSKPSEDQAVVEKEKARTDEMLVVPKSWAFLEKELPVGRDTDDRVKRNLRFKSFDVNNNGKIGVLEVKTVLSKMFKVPGVKEWTPAVQLAFKATRDVTSLDGDLGRECISLMAFRILCVYLQRYIQLWVIFLAMNTSGDNKLDADEFAAGRVYLAGLGFQHEKLGSSSVEDAFEVIEKANPKYMRFDEFAEGMERSCNLQSLELEPDDMISAICNQSYKDAERNATKSQAFIDFKSIRNKFPTSRSEAGVAERLEIWKMMDVNKDGRLTPFEVHQKLFRLLPIPGINDFQAPVRMAFETSKEAMALEGDVINDGIGWKGFYALIYHLHCYVELWVRFNAVDHSQDRRVTVEEFFSVVQQLTEWGLSLEALANVRNDHKAVFREVDVDQSGYIRFFEFADWCMQNKQDVPSDLGPDEEPAGIKKQAARTEKAERQEEEAEDRKKEIGLQAPLIDWGAIRDQFPSDWSETSQEVRARLWEEFDENGNGRLVIYEVQNLLMGMLHMKIRDYTPAVRLAFADTLTNLPPDPSEQGFDYCEDIGFREFRVFLYFLVRYVEIWIRFIAAESTGRKLLSMEEFSAVVTKMEKFPIKSAMLYGNLDTVAAVYEKVLPGRRDKTLMGFNEFARWCMSESGPANLEISDEELAKTAKEEEVDATEPASSPEEPIPVAESRSAAESSTSLAPKAKTKLKGPKAAPAKQASASKPMASNKLAEAANAAVNARRLFTKPPLPPIPGRAKGKSKKADGSRDSPEKAVDKAGDLRGSTIVVDESF